MKEELKEKSLVSLKNRMDNIQMNKAIQYCAGSEEFYIQCLKDYAASERKDVIERSYEMGDWSRYTIEVHALKSTSRTLGFEVLGSLAEKMQTAAEKQDITYIKENHESMLKELEEVLKAINECL